MKKKLLCFCNEVSEQEIKKLMKRRKTNSVPEIAILTGASMGCGRCSQRLQAFVQREALTIAINPQLKIEF